jgi:cyclopropane fatty-acyl-phospholipid synthase-like methyltransferase
VLPKKCKGKYLEIGPGHGYFMAKAMSTTAYDSFSGIDISPTSLELTKKFLDSEFWGETKNFNLVLSDFLEVNFKDRYDAIVMGEVLEHVEEPISFLEKIKSLSDGDTFIFVTTCINAPAIDHIKLFRNVDEVNDLIVQAGLQILDIHLVPYNNLDIDGSQKLELPINIALVLKNK